jgi:hypothetical protein
VSFFGLLLTFRMVFIIVCYSCGRKAEAKNEAAEKKGQTIPELQKSAS